MSTETKARCAGVTSKGVRCIARLRPGERYCRGHDPAKAEERKATAALGAASGGRRPGDRGTPLGELDGIARRVAAIELGLERKTITGRAASERLRVLRLLFEIVRARGGASAPAEAPEYYDLEKALGDC